MAFGIASCNLGAVKVDKHLFASEEVVKSINLQQVNAPYLAVKFLGNSEDAITVYNRLDIVHCWLYVKGIVVTLSKGGDDTKGL